MVRKRVTCICISIIIILFVGMVGCEVIAFRETLDTLASPPADWIMATDSPAWVQRSDFKPAVYDNKMWIMCG